MWFIMNRSQKSCSKQEKEALTCVYRLHTLNIICHLECWWKDVTHSSFRGQFLYLSCLHLSNNFRVGLEMWSGTFHQKRPINLRYYNIVWTHLLRGSFADLKHGTCEPFLHTSVTAMLPFSIATLRFNPVSVGSSDSVIKCLTTLTLHFLYFLV